MVHLDLGPFFWKSQNSGTIGLLKNKPKCILPFLSSSVGAIGQLNRRSAMRTRLGPSGQPLILSKRGRKIKS